MDKIILRNYQEKQLEFLQSNNGLVKGLQSPTGTGKSIVLLSFIKDCIEKDKYNTIVLSTGFNELVFQMEEDAKRLDINVKVIIGSGHLIPNCRKNNSPDFEFSRFFQRYCLECDPEGEMRKRTGSACSKNCIMNFLRSNKQKVILTNHSYFLAMKDYIKANLLIVDEAHTFGEFYMSYNTIAFSEREKEILNEYCLQVKTPTSQVLRLALSKGMGINATLLDSVSRELQANTKYSIVEIREFIRKMELVFVQKSFDNYLENSNGEYIKTKFFSKFDLSVEGKDTDIIITSATLDSYTLNMFNCTNKNQIYKQREDRNRYKGSHIISCYQEYHIAFDSIIDRMFKEYHHTTGLILCTSNENVYWSIERMKKFSNIAVFNDIKKFKAFKGTKVLIGSKKFYQGIDIPDLDFIILDKLPFSTYDNKFQAYSYFIEKVTRQNAWTGYTMPLMFNSLLQGIGRLWRKNDIENSIYDQGTVVVVDPRLEKKFNYIEKQLVAMKPGIELIRLDNNGKVIDTCDKEEIKPKRTRRKINKELTAAESDELIAESMKNSKLE